MSAFFRRSRRRVDSTSRVRFSPRRGAGASGAPRCSPSDARRHAVSSSYSSPEPCPSRRDVPFSGCDPRHQRRRSRVRHGDLNSRPSENPQPSAAHTSDASNLSAMHEPREQRGLSLKMTRTDVASHPNARTPQNMDDFLSEAWQGRARGEIRIPMPARKRSWVTHFLPLRLTFFTATQHRHLLCWTNGALSLAHSRHSTKKRVVR